MCLGTIWARKKAIPLLLPLLSLTDCLDGEYSVRRPQAVGDQNIS